MTADDVILSRWGWFNQRQPWGGGYTGLCNFQGEEIRVLNVPSALGRAFSGPATGWAERRLWKCGDNLFIQERLHAAAGMPWPWQRSMCLEGLRIHQADECSAARSPTLIVFIRMCCRSPARAAITEVADEWTAVHNHRGRGSAWSLC